jgi:hypothetical protein
LADAVALEHGVDAVGPIGVGGSLGQAHLLVGRMIPSSARPSTAARYDMTFNTASANLARNMLDGNRQNLTSPADGVWGAGGTNNVG